MRVATSISSSPGRATHSKTQCSQTSSCRWRSWDQERPATPNTGGFNPDTLTPPVLEHKSSFNSISHTWDHTLLDNATAALTDTELLKNNAEAVTLGLPDYSPANLATPAITGLNNAAFINEAVKDGLKYLVSDASVFFSRNKYQFRQTDHQDSKACIEHKRSFFSEEAFLGSRAQAANEVQIVVGTHPDYGTGL